MKWHHGVRISPAQRKALGTRKHSCTVVLCEEGETVTARAPHWDGGSRDEWWRQDRRGGRVYVRFPAWSWPSPPSEAVVEVNDSAAVVEGGIFRGKTSRLCVYATRAWLDAVLGEDWDR